MSSSNPKSKRTLSNESTKPSSSKRKFRNENEKRRRDLFSQLIANLENILNIEKDVSSNDQTNKLDKASILRETAIYLRKHQNDLTHEINLSKTNCESTNEENEEILDISWRPPTNLVTNEEWIQTTIESMNCFFLVAKSDPHNGQIVYVSRNISSLLDYSQNELLNRSLFELILPRDHDHLRDYLLKDHKVLEKCHLSWRRATIDEYEQCTIIGAFRQIKRKDEENDEKYLMSIVQVKTLDRSLTITNHHSINEFSIRLNLQGRFIHIDINTRQYLGYSSYELIGHTFFDFVHPDDLPIIFRAQQIWKENGSGKSEPYRFLSKGQQWIFIQTNCQVQINSWTGKPESYLCISNPLQNSTDFIQRHSSNKSNSSQMTINSIQSPITTTNVIVPPKLPTGNTSADTQITSFLSQLDNDLYRSTMKEKLNERRLCKQAEIRVREEEINVIEDLIQFINEHETKRAIQSPKNPTLNPSIRQTTTTSSSFQSSPHQQQDRITGLESTCDPLLMHLSLPSSIENSSPQSSTNLLTKEESILDRLTYPSLFSPQQTPFSISSPATPFSIPSRPSPLTSLPLSVSPNPSSPFPSSTHETQHMIPPTTSPHSSSSSSSTTTTTTTTANPNPLPTEQSQQRKSSFNRSLPHSLVS
ncbi:unnamed protein product [Adineta ricciae]|nr:unnamed protein product [Adineta ricciae]